MKRLLLSASALLLLAACGDSSPAASFDLTFDVADSGSIETLTEQSLRVIDRRLQSMGDILVRNAVQESGTGTRITVEAETQEALDALSEQLQRPFTLHIMSEVQGGQEPDVTVEGHGGFVRTGITQDDIDWVESRPQPGTTYGEVKIVFTEEGEAKMDGLFKRMKGKNIGLFVNDQLMSKLLVDTDEVKDDILIRDIPDPEIAEIFADDVNVGAHVTFTPVP